MLINDSSSLLVENGRAEKLSRRSGAEVDPDMTAVEKTGTAAAAMAAFCCNPARKVK